MFKHLQEHTVDSAAFRSLFWPVSVMLETEQCLSVRRDLRSVLFKDATVCRCYVVSEVDAWGISGSMIK